MQHGRERAVLSPFGAADVRFKPAAPQGSRVEIPNNDTWTSLGRDVLKHLRFAGYIGLRVRYTQSTAITLVE